MTKYLTRETMSPAQLDCFDMLCEVFYGEHHAPERIHAFGRGIKCSVYGGQLATFDFDYLTRLVILAHDRCIRVEVVQGAPGRVGLALFKRTEREGPMHSRHPTMEQAIANHRPKVAA
jgi:hypothetical protein